MKKVEADHDVKINWIRFATIFLIVCLAVGVSVWQKNPGYLWLLALIILA